jgi:hypothetical protein
MTYDETCDGTPADATVNYTETMYANVNTSNNAFFIMSATATKKDFTGDCIHTRYTFNVTQVNTTPIQWIQYCMEVYYYLTEGSEGDASIWFRNTTAWYLNQSMYPPVNDVTYCYNISANVDSFIQTDGTFQAGISGSAYGTGTQTSFNAVYVDFVNATVGFTPPADTCTYSSGDWNININDNCTLSTTNTVNGNIYVYGSNGWLNFQANQFAHGYYYNVSSLGTWYYNNYRWLY